MIDRLFGNPAFWSAVAASFAALSSFLLYLVHRARLLESVKPELVPTGWEVLKTEGHGDDRATELRFTLMRNVGRGVALSSFVSLTDREDPPVAGGTSLSTGLIPVGESIGMDGFIFVFWKNARTLPGGRMAFFKLKVHCWDTRSIRHETVIHLVAVDPADRPLPGAQRLTAGLYQTHTERRPRSVRRLKLEKWIAVRMRQTRERLAALIPTLPRRNDDSDEPALK